MKPIGQKYTASEQANARILQPGSYRSGYGKNSDQNDPRGDKRVTELHNRLVERHSGGLFRFVGDKLVLTVDPAKVKEVSHADAI
jgi:hypothetical protein